MKLKIFITRLLKEIIYHHQIYICLYATPCSVWKKKVNSYIKCQWILKEQTVTLFSLALIVDMILLSKVILTLKSKFNWFLINTFLLILRLLYIDHNFKKLKLLGIQGSLHQELLKTLYSIIWHFTSSKCILMHGHATKWLSLVLSQARAVGRPWLMLSYQHCRGKVYSHNFSNWPWNQFPLIPKS